MVSSLQKCQNQRPKKVAKDRSSDPLSLQAGNAKKPKKKGGKPSSGGSLSGANRIPLGKNAVVAEMIQGKMGKDSAAKEEMMMKKKKKRKASDSGGGESLILCTAPAAQQLQFFLGRFQAAKGFMLSALEVEAFKDTCVIELFESVDHDVDKLGEVMKAIFAKSWREVLVEGKLSEGIAVGSPAIIVISNSALRSSQIISGLKTLTKECRPAKLFAKHIKVEDQVQMLNGRVNIAGGTPSRIRKLIDMNALSLSRTKVIMIDLQKDAKGYSLLTLPQVSTEFWDLYKSYFNQRLLEGTSRVCFFGSVFADEIKQAPCNE